MNFLAHLYLSGDHEKVAVGNFIGDFVKGGHLADRFDPEITRGIEMHRAIDVFTDHHPVVSQSKLRLRPTYRHYSGVIVDVFYDHLLANNWKDYHPASLAEFASASYALIQRHEPILPDGVKQMLPHMIRHNWLVSYSSVEGIHQALSGMARRTTYASKMENASEDLKKDYAEYQREFKLFFHEARGWAGKWLVEHST